MLHYQPNYTVTTTERPNIPNYDADAIKELRKNKYTGIFKGEKIKYTILGAYSKKQKTPKGEREDLILELMTDKGYLRYKAIGAVVTNDGDIYASSMSALTNDLLGVLHHEVTNALDGVEIQTKDYDGNAEEQTWYPNIHGFKGNAIATTYRAWTHNGYSGFTHKIYFFNEKWQSATEVAGGKTDKLNASKAQQTALEEYQKFKAECLNEGWNPDEGDIANADQQNIYGTATEQADEIPF